MKYYWIDYEGIITEVDEKTFQNYSFKDVLLYDKGVTFTSKNCTIGGGGRYEISYFNKLVDEFLENEKIK